MESNAPLAPLPPPPPPPGFKRVIQTSRRLSYVNFGLKWFNSEVLSDIEIFSDLKSNGNSRAFRCHQLVLYLNSPELLEAIKNRPYEDNSTGKYIIIEDLQGKDKEAELFLKSLYDPTDAESYDSFNSIFTKYKIKRFDNGLQIPQEILPQLNSENKLSDIRLKTKDSENYFNCHRLFLAQNSEYFKGLFSSDMKDSSTNQTEISSSVLTSQEISENIGPFLESLYYGELARYPVENVDKSFIGLMLSQQYLLTNRDRWQEEIIKSTKTTANIAKIICNAIRYDTEDILTKTVPAMFLSAVQVVNLLIAPVKNLLDPDPQVQSDGFDDIPNEYLEQVTSEYKKKQINFIQACLKSAFDDECVEALKKLIDKVGSNSPLNLNCLDSDGNTCLHLACLEPKANTLKFLLEQPILADKIDAKNNEDLTPIQICLKDVAKQQIENYHYGFYSLATSSRMNALQKCFAALLASGGKVEIDKTNEDHKRAILMVLAAYTKEDPTFKNALKMMEQCIDFKSEDDQNFVILYGLEPALRCNNKTMIKYYLLKKGIKYTLAVSKIMFEQFGGSIADDRGMWMEPQRIDDVTLEIEVKDRSTLKIDGKSVNMKGAKYSWTVRPSRFVHFMSSYEAHSSPSEETCLFLTADGRSWELLVEKESREANFFLFFIELNNPGCKEERPDITISNDGAVFVDQPTPLPIPISLTSDPQDFAQRVMGSSTTAAINIVQKKKHK